MAIADVSREHLLKALIMMYSTQIVRSYDDNSRRAWTRKKQECEAELQRLMAG
ncbi:hypothetical protein [Paenibacillus chitinolyticus]